jgi:hypothetical protein
MTVIAGVVEGGDGYSAGGAGGDDSIALVVVAPMTRETLDSPLMVVVVVVVAVVAVAESSPWFFSFHGKGDDFCEMVCPRRDGWEGPGRCDARCGGGTGTTSAADAVDATFSPPPRIRRRARIRTAAGTLVSAHRAPRTVTLFFSFRTARRHF